MACCGRRNSDTPAQDCGGIVNASTTRNQRLFEYAAIGVFALLAGGSALRLAATAQWLLLPILSLAAPVAWLFTDLLSGVVHWACDCFGSVKTPVVGNAIIRPFREHHSDPQAMTQHDFVETHGASCFAALPFLIASSLLPLDGFLTDLLQASLLLIALGALATNQCHKWAHMDRAAVPAAIRWAQRHHLVLPDWHHRQHHTAPFDSHYCMSSGWLNPLFNAVLLRCRR
jgi:hypothetical protein